MWLFICVDTKRKQFRGVDSLVPPCGSLRSNFVIKLADNCLYPVSYDIYLTVKILIKRYY